MDLRDRTSLFNHSMIMSGVSFEDMCGFLTEFNISENEKEGIIEELRSMADRIENDSRTAFLTCYVRLQIAPWNTARIIGDLDIALSEELGQKYLNELMDIVERNKDRIEDFETVGVRIPSFILDWCVLKIH